jgi:hypothetical protein
MRSLAIAAVLLASAGSPAQDTRALAERLKAIVDLRLNDLRAELHREIDGALSPAGPRLVVVPASDEFRAVHRLPSGCGFRVVGFEGGEPPPGSLMAGDVIVSVGDRLATAASDLARTLARGTGGLVIVDVIRRNERQLVPVGDAGAPRRGAGAGGGAETADEVLERLWQRAIHDVVPAGPEPISEKKPMAESHPGQNSPIPGEGGRR